MPPRQPSPPPGAPRRRTGPVVPGGWIWVVIVVLLVGMVILTQDLGDSHRIEFSDILNLASDKNLAKVVFVGTERINGKVKDVSRVPEGELKQKLKNNGEFTVQIAPNVEPNKLAETFR